MNLLSLRIFSLEQNQIDQYNNPIWFIDEKNSETLPENLTFNMILNLASVCNAEDSSVLWGFIESYYPQIDKNKNLFLNELLDHGVNYYRQFILPKKKIQKTN